MPEPRKWTCECGREEMFGMWYAAHADIRVTHTCPDCGAVHECLNYNVTLIEQGEEGKKVVR